MPRDRVQGSANNNSRNNGISSAGNRGRQGGRTGNGLVVRSRPFDLGRENTCVVRGELAESAGIQLRADRTTETLSAED